MDKSRYVGSALKRAVDSIVGDDRYFVDFKLDGESKKATVHADSPRAAEQKIQEQWKNLGNVQISKIERRGV